MIQTNVASLSAYCVRACKIKHLTEREFSGIFSLAGENFAFSKREFPVALLAKLWRLCSGDAEGIVLVDYLEHGSTITGPYYADLIVRVRAVLKEKRRGKLRRGVLFHQDKNAPAHTSPALAAIRNAGFELLHQSITHRIRHTWPQVTYLFPKLKEFMKGS